MRVGGGSFFVVGVGLFETLQRGEAHRAQRSIAIEVVLGTRRLGRGGGDFGRGLLDHGGLQPPRGFAVAERRLLGGDIGVRPRQLGAIVAIVELHQEVAGLDLLVVGDRDAVDEARHLRGDGGDVAADVGVVGRFDEAPDRPPHLAVPGRRADHAGDCGDQPEAPRDPPQRALPDVACLVETAHHAGHDCLQKEYMHLFADASFAAAFAIPRA